MRTAEILGTVREKHLVIGALLFNSLTHVASKKTDVSFLYSKYIENKSRESM